MEDRTGDETSSQQSSAKQEQALEKTAAARENSYYCWLMQGKEFEKWCGVPVVAIPDQQVDSEQQMQDCTCRYRYTGGTSPSGACVYQQVGLPICP